MPLKLRSRGRAFKASADGYFGDDLLFDQQDESFPSWPEGGRVHDPDHARAELPSKLRSSSSSNRRHKKEVTNNDRGDGSRPNITLDTSLESLSPSSPLAAKSRDKDKKGKFNFLKFRRKDKRETQKSNASGTRGGGGGGSYNKQKGMTLLDDDGAADLDMNDRPFVDFFKNESGTPLSDQHDGSWGVAESCDDESGLQITFPMSPSQPAQITSSSTSLPKRSTVDFDDGFCTDATLDFQSGKKRGTDFCLAELHNGTFDSFEIADDWNLSLGSFCSFDSEKGFAPSTSAIAPSNNHAFVAPVDNVATLSPKQDPIRTDDLECLGPIDSDTLEPWKAGDESAYGVQQMPYMNGNNRNHAETWNGHEIEEKGDPQVSFGTPGVMQVSNESTHTPIDVDTLKPWVPATQLNIEKVGNASPSGDSRAVSNHEAFSKSHQPSSDDTQSLDKKETQSLDGQESYTHSHVSDDFSEMKRDHVPLNTKSTTAPLTLGLLAQISGLVDYDTKSCDQYGVPFSEHDDVIDDEEDAVAIENAARKTIEEHEKSGPMSHAPALDSIQLIQQKSSDVSPVPSNIEEDCKFDIDNNSSFSSFHSNSPFKINLSGIHNQSSHHIHDDVPHEFPKDAEVKSLDVPTDTDLLEADHEMSNILSQFHLDASHEKDESHDHDISNIRNFWKRKDKEIPMKEHTPSSAAIHASTLVEWPSNPADQSQSRGKEGAAFSDDFFSRNKSKKSSDVPPSVVTKPSTDYSFATELSSLCEQSFDLTEDGFQVPKRKPAKEVYRATKSANSPHSAKGFFWRSHPESSNVEVKPRKHPMEPKMDNPQKDSSTVTDTKTTAVDLYLKRIRGDVDEETDIVRNPSVRTVSPTTSWTNKPHKTLPAIDKGLGIPKDIPQQESSKCLNKEESRVQDNRSKQSPSMEWKKTIEAKIKSTSERVKAARSNATSPTSDSTTQPKVMTQPTLPTRAPSPFQANKNSFLNKWQTQRTGTSMSSLSSSNRIQPPNDSSTSTTMTTTTMNGSGIPIVIEKKPIDDDAISGCSSSIADRIKQFESKSQSSKPEFMGRSAPLNAFSLSKLRTMTNNVGGLWS